MPPLYSTTVKDRTATLLTADMVARIAGLLEGLADREFGGYGEGAKFLHAEANEFLFYLFETTGDRSFLDQVLFTLAKLRASRTFDAQDGGFFRYSPRRDWQEPHQEKLLEDQAALLSNYLHAFLLTEEQDNGQAADGLIDYLNTELYDEARGAFCACQDYYRPDGFSFRSPPQGPPRLTAMVDTGLYSNANAQVASAYFNAWWLLGRDDCLQHAQQIVAWLLKDMRSLDGSVYHYPDVKPHLPGLLTDAVMTGLALLDGYCVLHEGLYLDQAKELADYIVANHRSRQGGFFDTSATGPGCCKSD